MERQHEAKYRPPLSEVENILPGDARERQLRMIGGAVAGCWDAGKSKESETVSWWQSRLRHSAYLIGPSKGQCNG